VTSSSVHVQSPHVLREYAFIADGERGALIGPRGDVAWMCLPGWDGAAVFGSLIGAAGSYAVTPVGRFVWGGYYEPRSLIWRSRWVTETGIVECSEALAFPGDCHRAVLLRQVRVVEGHARLEVRLQPVAGFGRHHMQELHRDSRGCWHARLGDIRMRWRGAADADVSGDAAANRVLRADLALAAGERHDLVLEFSDHELPATPVNPAAAWADTRTAWDRAIPEFGALTAERDAAHSYAVMRGMTTADGGMVAASTMSLPERADEGANYDYRYVWIRDQCFAGVAVAANGAHPLVDSAVDFVAARLLNDGPDLMPAYTSAGGVVPEQRRLKLPGYPGGCDIVGNHVREQFQLDAFGEALLLFAAADGYDRLTRDHVDAAMIAIDAIEKNWRRADAGIWELSDRQWAHSRLTCAAGLRAVARRGLNTESATPASRLSALADAIVADVSQTCLHPSGRWQRAPDDDRLDAALLLPALRGALPPDDPRSIATYRAVRDELARDHYVYRFTPEAGLGSTDSAFLLCGFAMAMAAAQQDEPVAAMRYFERNRSSCGPPGLFSEEYDIRQRQMRGNLPQAFVHAVMFEASSTLAGRG
jgi:alpha,alpha-trehalase